MCQGTPTPTPIFISRVRAGIGQGLPPPTRSCAHTHLGPMSPPAPPLPRQHLVAIQMVKVTTEGDVASIEAVNRAHPFYKTHVVWEDDDAPVEDTGRACPWPILANMFSS